MTLSYDLRTATIVAGLGGTCMTSWNAIALNREQRQNLTQASTIEHARDACHSHAQSKQLPPIIWAVGFYHIIGLTADGPNPLSPFQIRYMIEQNGAD